MAMAMGAERGAEEEEKIMAATTSFKRISFDLEQKTAEDSVSAQEKYEEGDDEEEFAFAIPSAQSFEVFQGSSAEEIFVNGQIRPVYSFPDLGFGIGGNELQSREKAIRPEIQRVLIEERKTASTSCSTASPEAEDLGGASADSYCLWTPPSTADMRRRSQSTGESKRWRLRDLVIGRSHSDGKKKFIFLESLQSTAEKKIPATGEEKKKKKSTPLEMDMATAHKLFYSKGGGAPSGDRRKSYLPYRSHLVGFFNGSQPF